MTDHNDRPMTTGGWLLTMLLLIIPVVNIILYIVWACGVGNRSRVTYCRAGLLWMLIGALIYVVVFSVLGVSLASLGL
ncbi:MAG: hypothetical protein K9M45_08530 [Kiritimatiellales bacterium]|nr:hypothetical protein [Kiritimatiellales bacterium]